jgi:hypothetical protein
MVMPGGLSIRRDPCWLAGHYPVSSVRTKVTTSEAVHGLVTDCQTAEAPCNLVNVCGVSLAAHREHMILIQGARTS